MNDPYERGKAHGYTWGRAQRDHPEWGPLFDSFDQQTAIEAYCCAYCSDDCAHDRSLPSPTEMPTTPLKALWHQTVHGHLDPCYFRGFVEGAMILGR